MKPSSWVLPVALILAAVLAGCQSEPRQEVAAASVSPEIVPEIDAEVLQAQLEALGYVDTAPSTGVGGVSLYDRERAVPGFNLYVPAATLLLGPKTYRGARLYDMEGHTVRAWEPDFVREKNKVWATARIGPDGNLYSVYNENAVMALDFDGDLLWATEGPYHHDINFPGDGTLWTLTTRIIKRPKVPALPKEPAASPEEAPSKEAHRSPVIEDHGWAVIDLKDGKQREVHWFSDLLADNSQWQEHLRSGFAYPDVLHANTIHFTSRAVPGLWKKGDLMTSFRHWDNIAVFDRDDGRLLWLWGHGILDGQHDPQVLDDGTVLILDNGRRRKWSRVLRVDPVRRKVIWSYGAEKGPQRFYTDGRGLAQSLPGGNILISSSSQGVAFEITPEGEKVWEFKSPDILGRLAAPFRVRRIPAEVVRPLLARGSE